MSKIAHCTICGDQHPPHLLDDKGWCMQCASEFARIQARDKWQCSGGTCVSPISCAMKKQCLLGTTLEMNYGQEKAD